MRTRIKKWSIGIVLIVYTCGVILYDRLFFGVSAEDTIQKTNIVALFVDSEIYDDIDTQIERYTTQYIQQRLSNTKAVVFPINTTTFKAKDIVKILENIYFDGLEDETSTLIGTILIGNIPMPVVQQGSHYFPSIFPYTDFEEQQYIYDAATQFFVYNDNSNGKSEIWHGVINFEDNITYYDDYFDKLETYSNNPSTFVAPEIRYDDLIALEKYFNTQNVQYHANKYIFAEDAAYKRYTQLFQDILQGQHNTTVANLANTFADNLNSATNNTSTYDGPEGEDVITALNTYASNMQNLFAQGSTQAANVSAKGAPSKILDKTIPEFLRPYNTLIGNIYNETMRENIKAGGRWYVPDLDNHIEKIIQRDDVLFRDIGGIEPTFKQINDLLEKEINKKIDQEKYFMYVPLPVSYKNKEGIPSCLQDKYDEFEYFYFGKKASTITGIQDLSIYRGTFQNLATISGLTLTTPEKSIGGSYNIFSVQVEANRGYNYFNTQTELSEYNFDDQNNDDPDDNNFEDNVGKIYINREEDCQGLLLGQLCLGSRNREQKNDECGDFPEDATELPLDYAVRNRGGASPLNLTSSINGDMKLVGFYPQFARKPVYDIAGSKRLTTAQNAANTYLAANTYGSMIKVRDQGGDYLYPRCLDSFDRAIPINGVPVVPKETRPFNTIEYFSRYNNSSIKTLDNNTIKLQINGSCTPFISSSPEETRRYKTIDSRMYNISPTPGQTNAMNEATMDKPIDNVRNITFQGIGGGAVTINYPDLYDIQTYKVDNNRLVLKTTGEIEQTIITYLQTKVAEYNQQLQTQFNQRNTFYNSKASAFDLLAQLNTLASPKNRTYNTINQNFLVNIVGTDTIKEIAYLLRYQNSPRPERKINTTIAGDISDLQATFDVNQKITDTMYMYLQANNDQGPLRTPDYNNTGYEVAYINANDSFFVQSNNTPTFIQNIIDAQANTTEKNKIQLDQSNNNREAFGSLEEQRECGYNPTSPVPLVKRPAALICRAKQIAKKPFKIEINFPNTDLSNVQNFGENFTNQFPSLQTYPNQMNQYASQWSQVIQKNNNNQETINNLPENQAQNMQDIMQYIVTETNASSRYTEPLENQEKYIRIQGVRDMGNVKITVSATGDNCLYIPGESNNLCNDPIVYNSINPFKNPIQLPVTLDGNIVAGSSKAGSSVISFQICANFGTCITKTATINTLPGYVDELIIESPNTVLAGTQIPVIVRAEDRFNNTIGNTLETFTIQASTGTLNDSQQKQQSLQFQNFEKSQFIYQAPSQLPHNTPITIAVQSNASGANIVTSKQINVIQGTITVGYENNNDVTNVSYTLPSDIQTIKQKDQYNLMQYNANNLPKIVVRLKDINGNNISSMISVQTQKSLLSPGSLNTQTIQVQQNNTTTNVNQVLFTKKNNFYVDNGAVTIYLDPNMKAGEDVLSITIPGLPSKDITLKVNPAPANKVIIQTEKDSARPDDQIQTTITVYDNRDNQVTIPTPLEIGVIGPGTVQGDKTKNIIVQNGTYTTTVDTEQPGGYAYIFGYIDSTNISDQYPGFATVKVSRDFLPQIGLNVMYLNLRGEDRGNQRGYFSTFDKQYINDLIHNSPKLLTTTTQLINPDNINQTQIIIKENGQIINNGVNDIYMSITNSGLIYTLDTIGSTLITNTLQRQQINNIDNIATLDTNNTQNTIYYIPNTIDSIITQNTITNNTILINGEEVLNRTNKTIHPGLEIRASIETINNKYTLWEVNRQGNNVGQMIISIKNNNILQNITYTNIENNAYESKIIFAEGSTNGIQGIGIIQKNTPFDTEQLGYKSIQDSDDDTLYVGFRGSFKNITNFAGGQYVGEATKGFSSMFMINIGDPLVQRISDNRVVENTEFDGGLGQTIYTDPNKTILQTIHADINDDNLDDIVIAHTDGSIKILKNYGGTHPYKEIGNLMLIADTIKEIHIGDVDGNDYKDIIIRTNEDQARVYYNDEGIFDVDSKLICLDVAGGPDSLIGVSQLFFEDMDQDNNIDIVTNDRDGYIKIFYGGETNGGANYVSTQATTCDDQRLDRQENNIKIVKRFGIQLQEVLKVKDSSIVHRKNLQMPPDNVQTPVDASLLGLGGSGLDSALNNLVNIYEATEDTDQFTNNMNALMQSQGPAGALQNFDPQSLIALGAQQLLRYIPTPFTKFYPSYETLSNEQIAFIPIGYLTGDDKVDIYKYYNDINNDILQAGDEVEISVVIEAKANTTISFADQIRGPWIIDKNTKGEISPFDMGNIPDDATIHRKPDNEDYDYIIDDLKINSGDVITFTYSVLYRGGTPMSINVENIKHPDYPLTQNNKQYADIIVQPEDACSKYMRTFFNTASINDNNKEYDEIFTDLWQEMSNYYEDLQDNSDNNISTVTNMLQQGQQDQSLTNIQGIEDLFEDRNPQDMFQNIDPNNPQINLNTNINLQVLDDVLGNVSDFMDQALNGLCQGFTIGGGQPCLQPPVPFNMSFLTPGTFNIFGCTLFQDKGLPAFFAPSTLITAVGPMPFVGFFGAPLIGPGDTFYGAPAGTYPSMVRIYLSPTLTMQLGLAICLGPMGATLSIPKPFADLGGNCIVIKIPMPGCGSPNQVSPNSVKTQEVDPRWMDAAKAGTCNNPPKVGGFAGTQTTQSSSPFQLMTQSNNSQYPSPALNASTYGFGLINVDQHPISFSETIQDPGKLTLKAGPKIKLKIQGGSAKGLVKCIIQKWMDNQIKYLMSNLSQMSIGIYFPNPGSLLEGFENLDVDQLKNIFQASTNTKNKNAPDPSKLKGFKKMDSWIQNKWLQQAQINNASQTISNPFQVISKLFADARLITISQKDVNIIIPMIYSEDLLRYSSYLQTWLQTNQEILQERKTTFDTLTGICKNPTTQDSTRCKGFTQNVTLSKYVSFQADSTKLVSSVRQNLRTLELYQQFPLQLYERMHVIDRYLNDLSGLISNFVGTITSWLNVNANRFSQYVDAIVLLISIIKTRQVLIDFTVNRSQNCGTCTNDNYDYYSCSLAFLCPELPILPIPPFKLPNIYLDLSHINLGINITLPNFIFTPTSIPLPSIPNLPFPPNINAQFNLDISLPEIPVLPPPPQLPTLPSFIPQVNIELPVLPPAPKIPAIAPAIRGALTAAEFIGKIFCILKGQGVGLVSENGVKSKVEQMTQRSRNVPIFDYLDLTSKIQQKPLQGFDLQIDAFVNLQFNFDQVFQVFDTIADTTNKAVGTYVINPTQKAIQEGSNTINNNNINQGLQDVDNNININGELDVNSYLPDTQEVDYQTAFTDLSNTLHALKTQREDKDAKEKIAGIYNELHTKHTIQANNKEIENIGTKAIQIIQDKQKSIQNQKEQVKDYDIFIQKLEEGQQLISDTTQDIILSAALFKADDRLIQKLNSQENPMITYTNLNKQVADKYAQALNKHSPTELNMHPSTYNKAKQYIQNVQEKLTTMQNSIQTPVIAANTNPLLAQNNPQPCTNCNQNDAIQSSDLTQYVQGIFVKGNNDMMINVVNSSVNSQEIGDQYTHKYDANNDETNDIILRDNNSIYIKYADQEFVTDSDKVVYHNKYYINNTWDSPNDILSDIDNNGYIDIKDITIKVRDNNFEVKNFSIQGQDFDSISISRTNSDKAGDNRSGYIVQLNHRFDTFTDKEEPLNFMDDQKIAKGYILVLPEDTNTGDVRLLLDEFNNAQSLSSLRTGIVLDIKYVDPTEENIMITMTDLSRHWKYAQVATIHNISTNNQQTIRKRNSPRSNQIAAGPQILADTQGPEPEISLIREATNQTVGSGENLEGFVSTQYTLQVQWTDNTQVQTNRLQTGNTIIQTGQTPDTFLITGLLYTGIQTLNFEFGASDYFDNITTTQVTLKIKVPDIQITSIDRINNDLATITASISQDLDEGHIQFQRERNQQRKTLTGTINGNPISNYPLDVGIDTVTGGIFEINNTVGLFNNAGIQIAQIQPETANMTILPLFINNYRRTIDFNTHLPVINLMDIAQNTSLFSIYISPENLANDPQNIQILNNTYSTISLDGSFGSFSNGTCIKNQNDCILYISPNGMMYAPTPYHQQLKGNYMFDNQNNTIIYIIQNNIHNIATIKFIPKPMLPTNP